MHPYTHRHTGRAFCLALGKLRTACFALGQQNFLTHCTPAWNYICTQVSQHLLLNGIHSSFFSHCNMIWFTLRLVWHDMTWHDTQPWIHPCYIYNGNSPVSSGPHVGYSSELPCVGCGDGITLLEVTTQTWSYKWLPLQGRINSQCLPAFHLTGHCYNGRQPLNESSKFKEKKKKVWIDMKSMDMKSMDRLMKKTRRTFTSGCLVVLLSHDSMLTSVALKTRESKH